MALIKRKLRKAFIKDLQHLVLKHGSELLMGLVVGLVTDFFAEETDDSGKKGKKKHKKHR